MRKEIKAGNGLMVMNVCRLCGIGAGVTIYPDGVVFVHAERELKDGYCRDCWDLVTRRGKVNGNGAKAPSAGSASKPSSP
jgi:hypothetical protein